jgi:hypothetical protein
MYKFIQKNQKKFLAVFGVLLMIVFILPTSFKNSMTRGDLTIGAVDGEKITGNELGQAKSDLQLLYMKRFVPLLELGTGGDPRATVNVFSQYFQGDDGALSYLLLQKEAEKLGFSVSTQAADALVAASFKNEQMTQEQLDQITPAVGRFILVQGAFERASESVKASKPLVQYYIAQRFQSSKLNLVEYNAADQEKLVPAPTPEQIRQQYDKYGDRFPANSFLTTQPSAPGYKVPDRVKLQYLELPHAAVVESVLNELSPDELYRFDRDTGYPYYEKNQNEFPTPATKPVIGPVLPGSTTKPTPTTKPFEEVKVDIRKRLLTDASLSSSDQAVALRSRVAEREKQLRTELHDELARAYAGWAAARGGDSAATQPALPTTNPLVAIYPELDFLTAFANTFEAQYKVRPLVNSLANQWLTSKDLETQADIGLATAGETTFAQYVMHDLAPAPTTAPSSQPSTTNPTTAPTTVAAASTVPTTTPAETAPVSVTSWHPIGTGLRPFEPSSLLQDPAGNAYVFRLTAFEPGHKPPLADIEPEVIKQLRLSAAYQIAHDEAAKLLSNARIESKLRKEQKIGDLQGLPAAAKASGKSLIEAGPFQPRSLFQTRSVTGYTVTDVSDNFTFLLALAKLAKEQTPENLHPSTLIELPGEHKVLVAEMGDTVLPMSPEEMYVVNQAIAPMAKNALLTGKFAEAATPGSDFLKDWFELNNVTARVKYVKAKGA